MRAILDVWSLASTVNAYFRAGFQDGDLVPHEWFYHAFHLPEELTRADALLFMSRMALFTTALLEDHKIALVNEHGKGWRVVPPEQQAFVAASILAAYIEKGMEKSKALLHNARMECMSTPARRRHIDTSVRVSALGELMTRGRRDVFALFSPALKKPKKPKKA